MWFTEGENDPRISVIKVDPVESYYWDTKHNKIIVMMKRIVGAIPAKRLMIQLRAILMYDVRLDGLLCLQICYRILNHMEVSVPLSAQ